MGVRYPSVFSNTLANALPASNAETVVCVTPPLTLPIDSAAVFLFAYISGVAGTATTQWVARLRRGTGLTGTVVQAVVPAEAVVAGNNVILTVLYFDTPGAVAGQQYALTISQTSATGAASGVDVAMLAFAL